MSLPTKNEHYQDEVVRPITVKKQNKGKGDLINKWNRKNTFYKSVHDFKLAWKIP